MKTNHILNGLFNNITRLIILLFFSVYTLNAGNTFVKTYTIGSVGNSIKHTTDGGYIITGEKGYSNWLLKVDSVGTVEWEYYSGQGNGYSVIQTLDHGFANIGYILDNSWDLIFRKFNENGLIEWDYIMDLNYSQIGKSLTQTEDEGYIIFSEGIFDYPYKKLLLLKLNNFGEEEWNQLFSGYPEISANSVIEKSNGGYILCGSNWYYSGGGHAILISTDSTGAEEWRANLGINFRAFNEECKETMDGGYILIGYGNNNWSNTVYNLEIIKTDSFGNVEWNNFYGGAGNDKGYSILNTIDNRFIISGTTSSIGVGGQDIWLFKTDTFGNIEWNRTFGGINNEEGFSLDSTIDGGFIICGYTRSFGTNNDDLILIKTDSRGLINRIFTEVQEVTKGTQNEIPLIVHAAEYDQMEGMTFAVQVVPYGDAPQITEDLDIQLEIAGTAPMVTPIEPGYASFVLPEFDPPLSGVDTVAASLLVTIPDSAVNGQRYDIRIFNPSATTPDYELIELFDNEAWIPMLVVNAPGITGLHDVDIIENDRDSVFFDVHDPEGSPMWVYLDEAPSYVSLHFSYGDTTGFIVIDPPFGAESGDVLVRVTADEDYDETIYDSFHVHVNHYPYLEIPLSYTIEEVIDSLELSISLLDDDGDNITVSLASAPDYISYTADDEISGTVSIQPYYQAMSGDIVFNTADNGSPPISSSITIAVDVRNAPVFNNFGELHIPENTTLDTIITFSDQNGDAVTETVHSLPSFATASGYGSYGVRLILSPTESSVDSMITIQLMDTDSMITTETISVYVYETYLAGDVRPFGTDLNSDGDMEDAGEFGDDLVLAPDVINTFKVSAGSPSVTVPDSLQNLYDAFDVNPVDVDNNNDGDVYDLDERGGDGYIDVNDVILSLKRATGIPGYTNLRRVDRDNPWSTPHIRASRRINLEGDSLLTLNSIAPAGDTAWVPIWIKRSEQNTIDGLVSGFQIVPTGNTPSLEDNLEFDIAQNLVGSVLAMNDGSNYFCLLVYDLDGILPNEEILLGHLQVPIPENAQPGDQFVLTSQNATGSTPNYETVVFNHDSGSVITVEDGYTFTIHLEAGNNLISFPGFFENPSAEYQLNLLFEAGIDVSFLISQGTGLFYTDDEWSGNLTALDPYSGYWINVDQPFAWELTFTSLLDYCAEYETDIGNNLLSFNWFDGAPIMDALGVEEFAAEHFLFIIGQGVGLFNVDGSWQGNLNFMENRNGYWVNLLTNNTPFVWGFDQCGNPPANLAKNDPPQLSIPKEFRFIQSTEQAFYLIKDIQGVETGDIITAYCNDKLVGSAVWEGSYTTVPVMGEDLSPETTGFCTSNNKPEFKWVKGQYLNQSDVIPLTGNVLHWSSLGVFNVESLSAQTVEIPNEFVLLPAYPNPFNPVTTVQFGVPMYETQSHNISLKIYDINGRLIETLLEGEANPGYHSIQWDASLLSAGVYFIKLETDKISHSQKVVLMK